MGRPSNSHYHIHLACIQLVYPQFMGHMLIIPEEVKKRLTTTATCPTGTPLKVKADTYLLRYVCAYLLYYSCSYHTLYLTYYRHHVHASHAPHTLIVYIVHAAQYGNAG